MDVFKKRPPPHLATRVDICLYYRNQSKETSTRFDSARLYGLNDNDNDDGDALEDHHQLLSRCLSILLLPLNTGIVILKLGFIHSQTQTKPCPSDPVVSVESPLQLPYSSSIISPSTFFVDTIIWVCPSSGSGFWGCSRNFPPPIFRPFTWSSLH